MRSIARKMLLPVVVALGTCPILLAQTPAPPKQQPVDKSATRVVLGGSSGTPGTAVVVPVYFTPGEGVQVGRLKLEVSFVSANMKFDKIERGISAEMDDVDLKSDLKTAKNDKGVETSTLTIDAVFPTDKQGKKGISAGLLGYITLNISESGRPANITLRASAEASELGSGKPVANVKAQEAQVEVLAPGTQPAVACFFFNH
jgi:hypothetical protein